jgi:hypothetical protein
MNTDNNLALRWGTTTHRGIDYRFTWEYSRDMFTIHDLDATRLMKECIDLYIDHGITNRIIYSKNNHTAFMEWEVHGNKLMTKVSRL